METSAARSNYCIPSHVQSIIHILISVLDYSVPTQIFVKSIIHCVKLVFTSMMVAMMMMMMGDDDKHNTKFV